MTIKTLCLQGDPILKKVAEPVSNFNTPELNQLIDELWKNMVVAKDLGGVQLFADNDWKSEFVVSYGILGIPRFILIDPDGNIVAADAPRPSDPDLRTMLDELI